jgi:hypothetical protein
MAHQGYDEYLVRGADQAHWNCKFGRASGGEGVNVLV